MPERVGRAVGVAMFWVPAVLFVGTSTFCIIQQVFLLGSAKPPTHDARCDRALARLSASVGEHSQADDQARAAWMALRRDAAELCGDDDPSIQELTAVLLRMQKRAERDHNAVERDRARLARALAQYAAPPPSDQE